MRKKERLRSKTSKNPKPTTATRPSLFALRSSLFVLLICFAFSGATGLIYQVVWTRLLVLVFGSATAATATILAVFMGGLALGSAGAGRMADRVAHPVRIYGLLEGVIGLYAILVPAFLSLYETAYRWGWQALGGAPTSLAWFRLALTALILLPPTILMGATLPLLSRVVARDADAGSGPIGALYSANLLGAIAGAACGGFVLLPALGMRGTSLVAAGINFLLLVIAWRLDGRLQPKPLAADQLRAAKTETLSLGLWTAWLCFTLSGALAMLYEVVWTRALGLVIGSNSYAFTVMLTSFLTGLFLGSAWATRLVARVRAPLLVLGLVQTAAAVYTLIAYRMVDWLPWWNLRLFAALPRAPEWALAARFLLAALALLPPAICFGAVFPFAVRAFVSANPAVGDRVGRLYAGNTLGAIAGALLAGFWLVPGFGTQNALRGAMTAQAFIGLAVMWAAPRAERARYRLVALAGALLVLVFTVASPHWNEVALIMTQSARRAVADVTPFPYASRAQFLEELATDQRLLFSEDGATSHVAVVENPVNRSLLTNGHADASNQEDMPNQILLAALPLLLHPSPAPERVAVIGWGSGVTVGTALRFPIGSLTAVELEPKVLRAAEWFRDVNHDGARDPRVKIIADDGRNYLLAVPDRFDVIISEPSNAWQAGVCNLFTQEYFARARARLKDNGLFTLWIGYGGIPAAEVCGVLAALRAVFPYILLFRSSSYDLIAVASPAPVRIAAEEAAKRMQWPSVRADLERAHTATIPQLLAALQAGEHEIAELCGAERPNTDDNARLEYAVARVYEQGAQGAEMTAALKRIDRRSLARYLVESAHPH